MKTIIQLLIVALVVNGCIQGGRAALRHYQLKDAVEQEVRFGSQKTAPELHTRLVALAAEHGVAVNPGDVTVEKLGVETRAAMSYVEAVQLVPKLYTHQQKFDIQIRATSMMLK
jgi:hypothetical protein